VTGLEFPGRTVLFEFTFFLDPAVFAFGGVLGTLVYEEKVELPLYMEWNRAPALFVTLYSFQGNTEQAPEFLLGLAKFSSGLCKVIFIHYRTY